MMYKLVPLKPYWIIKTSLDMNNKEKILLQKGEELIITLDSIPTGGYQWHPVFDHDVIDLISHSIQGISEIVGGSKKVAFKFKGINFGITTLKMVYKRDWEQIVIAERTYLIEVTPP